MKIRPKNIVLYLYGGVSGVGRTSNNWYNDIHKYQRDVILLRLKEYGDSDDYMQWLNGMQHAHSYIWNLNKDRMDKPQFDKIVLHYLKAYSGDNNYYPYSVPLDPNSNRWQLKPGTNDNYNNYGIKASFNNGIFTFPGKRTSKDNPNFNYNSDGYFSGITDYRRLLGREGDWDTNSLEFKNWQEELKKVGYETYLDPEDKYYKLRRIPTQNDTIDGGNALSDVGGEVQVLGNNKIQVPTGHQEGGYGFDWNKLKSGLLKIINNPELWATGRLAYALNSNERIYGEALKGINPVLRLTYNTHRQVVGDEATKLAYYRRAAQGQTKAAQPFTSDADRQIAYMNEAKRIGDELRALGDLADNQEIRRTSDESNQHQWANTQRATEVANTNIASINLANALKHNLLALKHAAQYSSIDNFLSELQTRKYLKLLEEQAIDDLIFNLGLLLDLLYDDRILKARKEYLDILDKYGNDSSIPAVLEARKKYQSIQNLLTVEALLKKKKYLQNRNNLLFVKSGSKVTYKKKDDLLYKTVRDTVEHFRKMSKMSSDAQNRKTPKIEKLTSHPKGKTRKYLLGGLAPFVVYKPAPLGGETSKTYSQESVSSSKSSKKEGSDTLDMVKELFKSLVGKGLPSDVNNLYISMLKFLSRALAFGEEITSEDIASMYLLQMLRLNQILYLKDRHDKSEEQMIKNNATNEFAVDFAGRLVGLKDGLIVYAKSWDDAIEKGINPLTNGLLLNLRAVSPDLAGHSELDLIAANGVGIDKIAEFIKSNLPKIGTTEIEGYTKPEVHKIIQGIEILKDAPSGDYKYTSKEQKDLVEAALKYVSKILPRNMRSILDIHAGFEKTTTNGLIATLIASGINNTVNVSAVTGKAASNKDGSSEGDGNMLPSIAFFNGEGEKSSFIIQDKTTDGLKINTISTPITSKGYNTGSITFNKLESSDFGGQLLINQATMGDSLISSTGRNNIIIDGRIYQTELPIDQEAKRTTGIIKPDLRFLKNIEKADSIIKQKGLNKSNPKDIPAINKIYQENNLPILYTISNNKPTITSEYARFAIVNGIGTEDAFGDNPEFNDAVQEISSNKERELFEIMMQQLGDSKYKLNNGIGLFGYSIGETKLYKGTIYIPMVTSSISALAGTGFKAKAEEYNLIEARQQAADAAREMGFNPAGDVSNLK